MQEADTNHEIKYSIVIPHYNSDGALARLLDSIPIRRDIRIIVVDDMTDDGSFDRISGNAKYTHVVFERLDKKRYAGGARNQGLSLATGKWVLFADADDYFASDAFEKLDRHSAASEDIVIFKAQAVMEQTKLRSRRNDNNLFFHLMGGVVGALGNVSPCAKLFDRQFLENNHLKFNEVIMSDDVFFGRTAALAAEKIKFIDCVVYTVTESDDSLSKQFSEKHIIARLVEHRKSVEEIKRSRRVNMVVFSFFLGNYVGFCNYKGTSKEYKAELRNLRRVLGIYVISSIAGSLFKWLYTTASWGFSLKTRRRACLS